MEGKEGFFQKMGQTRSRLGRKRRGVISFRLSVVSQAAASLADWHRLPFGTQSNSFATERRTSRRRRRPPHQTFPPEPAIRKIGRHDASSPASTRPPRCICVSVLASGHRLRFLREAVAAAAAATSTATIVPATTATSTGVQNDRQPEAVRCREAEQGARVQQNLRAAPRVPDTSHPSAW